MKEKILHLVKTAIILVLSGVCWKAEIVPALMGVLLLISVCVFVIEVYDVWFE